VKQVTGFQCHKCKDIIYENRECACGNIATIFEDRFIKVYSDSEEFSIVYCFIDNENKLVKVIETPLLELSPIQYVDEDTVKRS